MKNIFLAPRKERAFYQKAIALFLTVSMNLSVGGLGIFLVPSAAYAVVVTPVTIFSDGFESGFSAWDSPHGAKWSSSNTEHTGIKSAKVTGNTGSTPNVLGKMINTTSYSGIAMSYWFRADDLEARTRTSGHDDVVTLEYTLDGTTWTPLDTITNAYDDSLWHERTPALPLGAANNPSFGIRFAADLDSSNDEVRIDDVLVSGIEMENTLTRCTDKIDNDGNGAVDLADSSCAEFRPTLTVVKNVVGGPLSPNNFILHVNDGEGFPGNASGTVFTYTEPTQYSVTEDQAANYNSSFGTDCTGSLDVNGHKTCTVTNYYDVCPNIEGNQETPPAGTVISGGNCIPVQPPPLSCTEDLSTMTVVSGTTTDLTATDTPAVAAWVHPNWTASTSMPDATWIWNAEVAGATNNEAVTFTKTFTATGTVTGGSITIAADNYYEASLNGTEFGSTTDEFNYTAAGADTYDVGTLLQNGTNTLRITVHNIGVGSKENPAGLLYKLTVTKNACDPTPPVPQCNPDVNLLANAGFEAPQVPTNGWSIIPFTDSALKWLGDWVLPHTDGRLGLELQAGVAGAPAEGRQLAELDGDHPTTIWQDIATIPGKEYQLDLKFSPRPDTALTDNILQILAGGVQLGDQVSATSSGVTAWMPLTRTFVATSSVTRVQFADLGTARESFGTYIDDTSLRCVGDPTPKAHVIATKIICDNESDLPNWGAGGHGPIDENTVSNFLEEHGRSCHVASGWSFQYAGQSSQNPGDAFVGEAQGFTTFGTTSANGETETDIPLTGDNANEIHLREVLQKGFIPFGMGTGTGSTSAEFYCANDVMNYDNFDFIRNPQNGATYQCVAFNAPKATEEPTDLCPNIPDVQETVPEGMIINNDGQCVESGSEGTTSLTVIKHVINDNGGVKHASEFTLHVNLPELIGKIDSSSMFSFATLAGIKTAFATAEQLFAPASFSGNEEGTVVYFNGAADYNVTEDQDPGYTTSMSEDCSGHIALGEHKTCTVTNDDIAPTPPPSGGGGSSTFDHWGCTDPSASNYDRLANRDDGHCQLPSPPPQTGGSDNGTPPQQGEPQGEVLGASTTEELPPNCTPYLRDYLKAGQKNDPEQVKLLQSFLNETLDAKLPVSGFFGNLTKNWVKNFQKKYHSEIIQPWEDAGYKGDLTDGTGYVYKTTKRYINILKCPVLDFPLPDLKSDLR